MVDKSRLVSLTQKLIRANSENPPGNESAVAKIVKKELEECGFEVKNYEFAKNRTNVIGFLKGKNSSRSLLLTPHLDTVPAGENWKHTPFGAEIVDNKIYGRGAADCKCNVAVCLEVAHQLKENGIKLEYDLIIAATADEETGSKLGIVPLLEKRILTPTHAIVTDGGDFKITIANKGLIWIKIFVHGKKAHGAYPWKGENAIEKASQIITDLKSHKFKFNPHPFLHPLTISTGTIKGGERVNIVPDECEFMVDLRFLPGMDVNSIVEELRKIIEKTIKKYELTVINIHEPHEISRDNPLVAALESAMRKNNLIPEINGSEGADASTFLQKYGIPAISFGAGNDTLHSTDEYVAIDDLVKGAEVLLTFLKEF